MTHCTMSLFRHALKSHQSLTLGAGYHGVHVLHGAVACERRSKGAGDGFYAGPDAVMSGGGDGAELLVFTLTSTAVSDDPMLSAGLDLAENSAILRLDQVSFPPGAVAWRHVHPGPGIRCLLNGTFEVRSDSHVETIHAMTPWFEAANSPVQATASPTQPTAFVRAMVLPMACEGKPTITYLDAGDAAKPKLQSNHRFFDQRIDLTAL